MSLCEVCPHALQFIEDNDGNTIGVFCSVAGEIKYDVVGHISKCRFYPQPLVFSKEVK